MRVAIAFVISLVAVSVSFAQATGGIIRGTVTDPSGAAVAQAMVTATPVGGGPAKSATTNRLGAYQMTGVAPGTYNVAAMASGFALFVKQNVQVTPGQIQALDVSLVLEEEKQQVTVQDQSTTVDVAPTANASQLVIKGEDLDALSDDPDELQTELSALAGPSAGPNGGQFYVDGFTAGQLPPKSSIREIRINQNPFSPEYDKLGYGRIEILTKPGADQFHGQFLMDGNDLPFDTRNPFAPQLPGYNSFLTTDDITGPISKKASFTFDFQRRNVNNTGIVNAVTLNPTTFDETPVSEAIANPQTRMVINPRIDYQLTKNNTLTVRYQYWHDTKNNSGIGQFVLPENGYDTLTTEDTVQVTDNQIISPNVINETRFQYLHDLSNQTPLSLLPQISVIGAFTGGGSNQGTNSDVQNHYELQNYTSMALGKHFLTYGGRLRAMTERNSSTGNFNGTYTFSSLTAYIQAQEDLANGITPTGSASPTQFSLMAGTPAVNINLIDVGVYFGDDWRVRPNLTLSYGLRFETQNDISDHADWAPRLAVSWGINRAKNGTPRTVIRAGAGIFYDRFTNNLVLQAAQENGIVQTEYILPFPSFYPMIPNPATILNAQLYSTVYRVASDLRAPYIIQSAASVEQQVTKHATVSVAYLHAIGDHQLLTNNINAPLPGYYNPSVPFQGRPLDTIAGNPLVSNGNTIGNLYEYQSDAIFRQDEVITNFNISAGSRLSFFGYYALNYANSDTGGPSTFPSNPYDIAEDYGRATFDIRDRVFVGGTIAAPYGFRLSPFISFQSGTPFNITLGQDLNGTTIFNQRPAFVNSSTPAQDVIATRYGTFNMAPTPGEPLIPINYGTGPNAFAMNLRVSKTFALGKKVGEHTERGGGFEGGGGRGGRGPGGGGLTGGGERGGNRNTTSSKYNLTFSASGRNIFNNVNLAAPVGNLTSPLFGRSNGLQGGQFSFGGAVRRIDLQATFSF